MKGCMILDSRREQPCTACSPATHNILKDASGPVSRFRTQVYDRPTVHAAQQISVSTCNNIGGGYGGYVASIFDSCQTCINIARSRNLPQVMSNQNSSDRSRGEVAIRFNQNGKQRLCRTCKPSRSKIQAETRKLLPDADISDHISISTVTLSRCFDHHAL